ncbi:rho-related GTP-binding protein RhoG-like isoform X4 [Dicentrarchus labrax]|uniref:rho-related GTP-binding protein RhoG-like isoform X4 n=1 Tax=Dicentrarchus labrax TaxID=13489 RepID=UPI0021F599D0|nr:rho-related GTP-binding protein RhoG-like isoform X4 [Dicentrarchus labrax]
MQSVKCVVVGDKGVGKSYLLHTYINKIFPKVYTPCFYGTYSTQVHVDSQTVSLNLQDTGSSEEYDRLRPLCYSQSDLRDDEEVLEKLREQNQTTVTQQQGATMAKQIKAVKYLECASMSLDGLDEVFDEAVRAFLSHSATTMKPCVLL